MPRAKHNITTPIHPGEILLEEFLQPMGITPYKLAKDIGVTPIRISEIIKGKRSITADTAVRLARYFGTSAQFWVGIQTQHDLEAAEDDLSKVLARIKPVVKQAV